MEDLFALPQPEIEFDYPYYKKVRSYISKSIGQTFTLATVKEREKFIYHLKIIINNRGDHSPTITFTDDYTKVKVEPPFSHFDINPENLKKQLTWIYVSTNRTASPLSNKPSPKTKEKLSSVSPPVAVKQLSFHT